MNKLKKNQINVKDIKQKIQELEAVKFSDMKSENLFGKLWQWRKHRKELFKARKMEPKTVQEQLWSWTKTIVGAIIVVMILNGLLIASFVVPTGSMERTVMTGDFLFVNKFIFGPSTPQVIPFVNIPLPFYKLPALRDPKQGDVIVFIFPGNRDEVVADKFNYYLKRCIAVAGDSLQIVDKRVFVNNKEFLLPEYGQFYPFTRESEFDRSRTFPRGMKFSPNNYGPIRIPKEGDIVTLDPQNWRQWEVLIRREGHSISYDGTSIILDGKPSTKYKIERNYCFGMGDNRDNSEDSRFFGFIPYDNIVGTPILVYLSLPDRDDDGRPYSILERIFHMRIERVGKIIN
jgi:signal peptidase I